MRKLFHSKTFFIVVLILLHAVFFFNALQSGNIYLHNDSDEYLAQAENILHHQSWYQGKWNESHIGYLDSRRPPLTGIVIAFVKAMANSDYSVCIFQCLLSIFNFLIIIKSIQQFSPTWNSYGNILLPLLFFPTQFIYSNMIMAEVFFQTTLLCAFYFAIKYFILKKSFFLLWFHLILTTAVLIKPVLVYFWIPLSVYYSFLLANRKIKFITVSSLLIFPLVIFIISYRNYSINGVFQYSSVKENYLPNYAVLKTVQLIEGREQAITAVDNIYKAANQKPNYKEYHDALLDESFKILSEHKPEVLFLIAKGFINFFIDAGRWDLYSFFYTPPQENMKGWSYFYQHEGLKGSMNYFGQFPLLIIIYMLFTYLVNIVITSSFILFLFTKNIKPEIRIFIFLLVVYIALMTGMIGSARFRMAVHPILLFTFVFAYTLYKQYVQKLFQKNV